MYLSDDPALDAERYMNALDIRLAKRPKCHCCGEHIQDEQALHYTSSEFELWLCPECMGDNTEYIEVD